MKNSTLRNMLSFIFIFVVFFLAFFYREPITKYIVNNYIYKKNIDIPESNKYKRNYNFKYIKITDNFYPHNRQDLLNVFYTILNNGYTDFTFYCADDYKECEKDIMSITDPDDITLSSINNYVHPFNSYKTININMNNLGRISVKIKKLYSDEDIEKINNEVDRIYNALYLPSADKEYNIKRFHNYIINHTIYDKAYANNPDKNKSKSNTAYGPLFNHIALCGGYTDLMELFLEKMEIKSYKISSTNHIWNYVYLNNSWKHLDLTWDDPVTNTGEQLLKFDYFMITTNLLELKGDNEHKYEKIYYLEAN